MPTMTVNSHLDWLTATATNRLSPQSIIAPITGLAILESCDPPRRFDRAWKLYPAGLLAHQKDGHKTAMLWLTGQDLAIWRETGFADQNTIDRLAEADATITRLDFCINVFDAGKVSHCANHLQAGKREGRPKAYARIQMFDGGGDTLYFGSPSSQQRVTIYDKAKQLKLADTHWLRIEARIRKKKATPLAQDMARAGVSDAGRARIRQLVDFPGLRWYQAAVAGPEVAMTPVQRTQSDLMRWLYLQVMPTFEKSHEPQLAAHLRAWLREAGWAMDKSNP